MFRSRRHIASHSTHINCAPIIQKHSELRIILCDISSSNLPSRPLAIDNAGHFNKQTKKKVKKKKTRLIIEKVSKDSFK